MPGIGGSSSQLPGASCGIGEATALLLAERGAKLVLSERGSNRLEVLAARIGQANELILRPTAQT